MDIEELVDNHARFGSAAPEREQDVGLPAGVEDGAAKAPCVAQEILRIKGQKLNLWDDISQFYRQFGAVGDSYQSEGKKITSRELFYAEAQIIRNLASQESCIVVGRTGFHIFKDDPDALHIFLIADRDLRIKKVAEREGLDEKAAAKYVDETDEARETFTKYFAGVSRYDARNYDLVINVSRFTSEEVATFLADNLRKKLNK